MKPKPEFTVKEIFPRIFHLKYRTQAAMTRGMIRFQESYEHPVYRGKTFRVRDIKRHAEANGEEFNYFTDTFGFNFPAATLEPFFNGKFAPLSRREGAALGALRDIPKNAYVIATYKSGDPGDSAHEIFHALYSTRPKYRKKVKEILADQAKAGGLKDWEKAMRKAGYHEDVILDEIHAYMGESDIYILKRFGKEIPRLARFKQTRKLLWNNYNSEIEK